MKFQPEVYAIRDERMKPFIDPDEIWNYLNKVQPSPEKIRAIIEKSLNKTGLT